MKSYIESYHMFFPDKKFKLLLYLVYPLAVWTGLFIESIFFDESFVIILTAASLIIIIECMADFFVFAGYARKDIGRNEYLKTSVKYTQLLKRALLSDVIRRFLSTLLIISVTSAVLKIPFNLAIFIFTSVNFFIAAALFVLRFFDFFSAYNFITIVIVFIYTFFNVYVFFNISALGRNIFIGISTGLFILSILLIIFHIRNLFKVVKEEYYD